jgi:DNA-directed RNA polymerase subunit beta'
VIEPLSERLTGRVVAAPIVHPETGEVLVEANELIDEDTAEAVEAAGIKGS